MPLPATSFAADDWDYTIVPYALFPSIKGESFTGAAEGTDIDVDFGDIIDTLEPSARGELEITDVNNAYIDRGELTWDVLEGWWTDAGTFESLFAATKLVAETIRHEYYYDESAGVPVCLEKAIKAADRRLRSSREGAGLPPGSLGVAAAVIRNNELYLATLGGAEAYLVRSARLLMPDRSAPAGLPGDVEPANFPPDARAAANVS